MKKENTVSCCSDSSIEPVQVEREAEGSISGCLAHGQPADSKAEYFACDLWVPHVTRIADVFSPHYREGYRGAWQGFRGLG